MFIEIPLEPDLSNQEFTATLEDVTYGFRLSWNDRMEHWSLTVLASDGTVLVAGVKVVAEFFLLNQFRDRSLPPGKIVFVDTQGQAVDPGRDDLGTRVFMGYVTSDEVAS